MLWYLVGCFALIVGVQSDTDTINALMEEHEVRTVKKLGETTLDAAWRLVKSKQIPALNVFDPYRHTVRARKLRHGMQGLQVDANGLGDNGGAKGYGAVDKAVELLNNMITEAQEKYTGELDKCCDFDKTQSGLMNETRVAISWANKRSAEAAEKIMQSRAGIESCEKQLPVAKEDLKSWKASCKAQIKKLKKMIKILKHDINVSGKIINASGCANETKSKLLFYECTDECGEYENVAMEGMNMTPRMREIALQLHDKVGESEIALQLHDRAGQTPTQPTTTLQPQAGVTTTSILPRSSEVNTPCKKKRILDPQASSCKLTSNSAVCKPLLEKFTNIQTGLIETKKEKEGKLISTMDECERVEKDYVRDIAGLESSLKEYQTALASATATKNGADEVSRSKGVQLVEMIRSYEEMTTECHGNYDELENEICALTKIRMTVSMNIKGTKTPDFFQDCKVSKWSDVSPGCSVSCGGGVVKRERHIEVHPVRGTACPTLNAVASCNTHHCPIDCKLGDWSGWGACSARECGGGVQDRTRPVNVEPMYSGEQCGETEEVRNCNMQACDVPCKLSDWTVWTNCSKACNRGHTQRIRTILEPSVGQGECWKANSEKRLQKEFCNIGPCPVKKGQILQCQSKKDIVVLVDGSGSVGRSGWNLEIETTQMLRKAINPGVSNMAVLVFSGPVYEGFGCNYYYCVGETDDWYWHEVCYDFKPAEADCGTTRVSDLSNKSDDLKTAIEGAKWPGSTTFTAKALSAVESVLNMGEKGSEAVVIVMTDGYPADKIATKEAAHSLNKQAKVIWVPITAYAPLDLIKEWASDAENVIPVEDFESLNEDIVNQITATACDDLKTVQLEK